MTKEACVFSGSFAPVNYKRDDDFLKALGQNIRRIRQERGMTMESLAYSAEMEIRQLGRIEGGEINTTVSTVLALAKALDIDISDLFKFPYKK